MTRNISVGLDPQTYRFYQRVLRAMNESGIPYLVGGAYAFGWYTGIQRHTKDLDLFLKPGDCGRAVSLMQSLGYRTEITEVIWLAKAFSNNHAFVDFIYRSGNGVSEVDDEWYTHSRTAILLDTPVKLCPPEETIWTKAYIMERERFDGPDVAHYILVCGKDFDWPRLLKRFGPHWRVLMSHLALFGFIYPDQRNIIPRWVIHSLIEKWTGEEAGPPAVEPVCQGTLLSRTFYLADVGPWGKKDARFEEPRGTITQEQLDDWRIRSQAETPQLLKAAGISVNG